MNGVVASALLICPVASVAAGGQTPDSSAGNGSSLQLVVQPIGAEAPAYVAFSVEDLLGDPGGIRINLEIQGVYGLVLDGVSAADVLRARAQ